MEERKGHRRRWKYDWLQPMVILGTGRVEQFSEPVLLSVKEAIRERERERKRGRERKKEN